MSRILLAFLSLTLLCLTSCAPKSTEVVPKLSVINIIDQNGLTETISTPDRIKQYEAMDFLACQPYKKVMRIYTRDERGQVRAFITSYHTNGQAWQYLEVVNGRAFGTYQEWFNTGRLKIRGTVISGVADIDLSAEKTWLFDGLCEVWDEEGRKAADLPYSKGYLDGTCLYYHSCGSLWKSIPCAQGKKEGLQQIFLENGNIFSETEFNQDEANGLSRRYWSTGELSSEESFCRGRLICGSYWDTCGQLISDINSGNGKRTLFGRDTVSMIQQFIGGVPEGKVEIYNARGKLTSIYHVKEGAKHGEEVQLYPGTLEPKLSISWYKGKVQGLHKTWYKNGQVENQREMSDNKKNGLLTAWYLDGNLMMIEEYDHDKLVRGEYYRKGDKRPLTEVQKGKGIVSLFDPEGNFLKRVPYNNGQPETL